MLQAIKFQILQTDQISEIQPSHSKVMKMTEMYEGFGGSIWSWIFFKKWDIFDSVRSISICYALCALFFGLFAVITSIIYIPLQDLKIAYADLNGCLTNSAKTQKDHTDISKRCEVTFQITQQIQAPVHFLYYVQNAYINHRGYLNSYSKKQLQGNMIDETTAKANCHPFIYNKDIGKNVSWSGKPLDPDGIANPCGFRSFLFFNDSFKLKKIEQTKVIDIRIDESQIDRIQGLGIDFKSRNPDEEWINPTDKHFMIWMQTQALMTKQKLWGRISEPLKVGKYSLIAQNNYKIDKMRITKGVRIIEPSSLGGKSYFIPISFTVLSLGCLVFAIVFYKKFKSVDQKKRDE